MTISLIKQVFALRNMITRKDLIRYTKGLDAAFNCVDYYDALEDKRGYDNGKQFPVELYRRGVQKRLLDNWLCNKPNVYILRAEGYDFHDAGSAGCEWAAYLRVRSPDALVLRVHPKDRTASPERILCQILSSLLYNFAALVPAEFDRVPDLCKRNFEALAQGGSQGIGAGLRVLEALPPLDLGGKKLLCVVDALDLAESQEDTADSVRQLTVILRRILARNNGHLLYTVAKKSKGLV